MAITKGSWHPPRKGPRPVRVQVLCAHPGSELGPTLIEFLACPTLGATSREVDAEITQRMVSAKEFELPTADGEPLAFITRTICSILVGYVRP